MICHNITDCRLQLKKLTTRRLKTSDYCLHINQVVSFHLRERLASEGPVFLFGDNPEHL